MSRLQKNTTFFGIIIIITFMVMYLLFINILGSIGALMMAGGMAAFTLISGAIIYAVQHYRQQKAFAQKQKDADDRAVHQTRTFEIDLSFDSAFDLALESLETLDDTPIPHTLTGIPSNQRIKIRQADRDIGRINVGLQAKTLGIRDFVDFSRIEIQLQRIDQHSTRLQIDSRPSNPLEQFDLGRHTHYVNHLAVYIRQAAQADAAAKNLLDEQHNDFTQMDSSSDIEDDQETYM